MDFYTAAFLIPILIALVASLVGAATRRTFWLLVGFIALVGYMGGLVLADMSVKWEGLEDGPLPIEIRPVS